jgi:Mce-associated membrane protein
MAEKITGVVNPADSPDDHDIAASAACEDSEPDDSSGHDDEGAGEGKGAAHGDEGAEGVEDGETVGRARSYRLALLVGTLVVVGLTALTGGLGYRFYESHQAAQRRMEFLQVGREAAVNLTTIDWHHADADVQRILSTATGGFYSDFSKRSQPFVDVVKQTQATSQGVVTAFGVESATGQQARVLVAVSVQSTNAGAQQPSPRLWRMRIDVQTVGRDVKVSNVEFVP